MAAFGQLNKRLRNKSLAETQNGVQLGLDMTSMRSPMRIPVAFKCEKESNLELEIVSACELLNEPEREHSPESPRNNGPRPGGIIPSFGSTVSEYDYPEYASSNAMDAATEQGHRTQVDAVPFPVGEWNAGVMGASVFGSSMMNFSNGQQTMQSAEELDLAAEQLIAAAMQARAAAAQLKGSVQTAPAAQSRAVRGPAQAQPSMYQPMLHLPAQLTQAQLSQPVSRAGSLMRGQAGLTTVMLRNLPNDYTREMVLDMLNHHGFAGMYDFVYLPVDFKRKAGLGYAFVNFSTTAGAEEAFQQLQGFTRWQYSSSKVLEVAWGEPLQGLNAHIERYRNSPVMHAEVPDDYRPMIFQNGMRVPFPSPTKRIQKPRMKA